VINKSNVLGGIVVLATACCVVLAALMVGPGREYCPRPSSESVSALFAPCQAFDTAMGRSVTKQEAVQMALLTPDGKPAAVGRKELSPPEEAIAEERQDIAQEHATVGVAHSNNR